MSQEQIQGSVESGAIEARGGLGSGDARREGEPGDVELEAVWGSSWSIMDADQEIEQQQQNFASTTRMSFSVVSAFFERSRKGIVVEEHWRCSRCFCYRLLLPLAHFKLAEGGSYWEQYLEEHPGERGDARPSLYAQCGPSFCTPPTRSPCPSLLRGTSCPRSRPSRCNEGARRAEAMVGVFLAPR